MSTDIASPLSMFERHSGRVVSGKARRPCACAGMALCAIAFLVASWVAWVFEPASETSRLTKFAPHAILLVGFCLSAAGAIAQLRRAGAECEKTRGDLAHAVEQWEVTFHAVRNPLFVANAQGTIVRCNGAFAALLGEREEDIVGRDCHGLVHRTAHCIEGCPMAAARTSGRRARAEFQLGDLWLEAAVDPILDDSGKVSGIVHVMTDITQSKRALAELSRNCDTQTALNDLLRSSLENAAFEEVLRRSLDIVLSIPWLSAEARGSIFLVDDDVLVMKVHKGLPDAAACARVPVGHCLCGRAAMTQQVQFAACIDDRHQNRFEGMASHGHYCVPIVSAGRSLGVLELCLKDGHQSDPKEVDFLRSFADALAGIVERKRTEWALQRSEKRFRTLFNASRDAIMTLAPPTWRFTSANPATVEMFRCESEADFIRMAPWQLSPERQPDGEPSSAKALRMIETAMQCGSHFFDWVHQRKDGEAFPATVLLTRVELDDAVFLQATVRDVTEAKLAEERLWKKEEELRQSQKLELVGQLAGGIAHEFNNLLQAIGGYTSYAMAGLSPGEQRYEDLQQVAKATERAAILTRQLLGFGRRHVMERRSLDVNPLVADLAKMVRPVIGEHIELKVVLSENVGSVHGDPVELQQAILNLCLNSRDAMPSGGELILRTETASSHPEGPAAASEERPGRCAVISVTDTGCGMTPEIKERIFEPFFTTKEVGKGTGLGLAKVYGVVQQHGGAIHVYSEPGKGTTFRLYLPLSDAASEGDVREEKAPSARGSETVLVAEDEPLVRELAVRALTEAGYTVLVASDGEESLRVFEENRGTIHLVLLDVVMPKLSGREVFRRINAQNAEVKVVFCTGYDPQSSHCRDIAENDVRLVQKPVDPASLLRSVREVLDAEKPV